MTVIKRLQDAADSLNAAAESLNDKATRSAHAVAERVGPAADHLAGNIATYAHVAGDGLQKAGGSLQKLRKEDLIPSRPITGAAALWSAVALAGVALTGAAASFIARRRAAKPALVKAVKGRMAKAKRAAKPLTRKAQASAKKKSAAAKNGADDADAKLLH